jgi:thiamine pyridinylase
MKVMRRVLLFVSFLLITVVIAPAADAKSVRHATVVAPTAAARPLRVVLYPFVPDYADFALKLVSGFQSSSDGAAIPLQLIDLSANYYDPTKSAYVGKVDADVYELDSVFLNDFAHGFSGSPRIQPLPSQLVPQDGVVLANAVQGATLGNVWYGVPHWVCSNFLFFKSGDAGMSSVKTFADLGRVFPAQPIAGQALLVDLKGKSTLGEFYLMDDVQRTPDLNTVYAGLSTFSGDVENDIRRLRAMCEQTFCRNSDYHYATGFYGRQFARGHGRAVIGYSELLHDVLFESTESCAVAEKCLTDGDLDVAALPLTDHSPRAMSWVDSYVIAASCTGACLQNAIAFIRYATAERTVRDALMSDSAGVPRYLLPARASLYSDASLTKSAHLYPKLKTLIEQASAPSTDGLNVSLRGFGAKIDSEIGP